ncbi:MAG: DUF4159 domain-containing protein [Alphaproteobacteria bacterium]|nr:DUF4159 domain-containing protein [Alphaproteobacteria bacterium]MBV9693708.1 DUF4159 domain-containing protein [Alphaproteobacteria bacterium]
MTLLSQLSFGTPWILFALAVLPVIWLLLRVTPPAPRRIVFPPLRLLLGLKDSEETPAHTPLWLLLLRLLAAAAIILALAEPLLGRDAGIEGSGPIVLFVDNGWTAAHGWEKTRTAIADTLRSAAQSGRGVAIVTTADVPDVSLLDIGSAERRADSLAPQPWAGDRARAAAALARAHLKGPLEILWLSDGIGDPHARDTADTLARLGSLKVFATADGPLALPPPEQAANAFTFHVQRAGSAGGRSGAIQAQGLRGEILGSANFRLEDGKRSADAKLILPLQMRNETARFAIANEPSAGAVQLLDAGGPRRAVGLVSAANNEGEQPLLSDTYYLERALAPYADLRKGSIATLLTQHVGVLVLAGVGKIPDVPSVARFVSDGGLLIRFAGERLTGDVDELMPVKLRGGGRYLGGALAWAEPQHLASFSDNSPFGGLDVPKDVTVSRQILAEPSIQLSEHTWARLADGTPLVTAAQRGKGWIVLFHITAGPSWSSLPLSGLYVDMLRRLLMLANGTEPGEMANAATLPAFSLLDGFGRQTRPASDIRPLKATEIARATPSRAHPPGLYGVAGAAFALNEVSPQTTLEPLGDIGVPVRIHARSGAIALEPALLLFAAILLLIDALISLSLRGYVPALASVAAMLLVLHPHDVRADDAFAMKAALDTRLAYVQTGLADVDAMSRAGLSGLGLALAQRTSYTPKEPVAVDIARDDLTFFPLLYWPMDPREADLPPQAVAKISDYMRNGGTILFDSRDLSLGAVRGADSPGEKTLRRLTAKLDLPPLQVVPTDHVLTKSFYILRDFPGRWDGGKVWVQALPPADAASEALPARGGDGVSPVIIGSNDWAAAWAVDGQGTPVVDPVPGGGRQRELAIRFGINLVMYALTGNYKADTVHMQALLQRMGH